MRRRDFVKGLGAAGGLSMAGGAAGDSSFENLGRFALPTGGSTSYWTTAEKYGAATVPDHHDPQSYVWFTCTEGALTEARFPRADLMNLRALDFLVVDPDASYAERTLNATRQDDDESTVVRSTEMVESDAMVFEQTVEETASDRSWTLTVEYAIDVAGDAILADVSFAGDGSYDVYAVANTAVSNSGTDDRATREGSQGDYVLTAVDTGANDDSAVFVDRDGNPYNNALSLVSADGFSWASVDVAAGEGNEEPWASDQVTSDVSALFDGAAAGTVAQHTQAEGNVVLVGQVFADVSSGSDTLGLGFAEDQDTDAAITEARDALNKSYAIVRSDYVLAWEDFVTDTLDVPNSVKASADGSTKLENQYKASAMTLKVVESKQFPGASLASPSVPWGDAAVADEPADYGYNYTWSRDLYNVYTALEAMGDVEGAKLSPEYIYEYQQGSVDGKPEGYIPQNTYFDGRPRWPGEQMDNVSFPQIMAYQLKERHGYDLSTAGYAYENVKASADYVAVNGPITDQERWEEEGGLSPSTTAAEIAGLACAASLAADNGEMADARLYLAIADHWQANVADWCTTVEGTPRRNEFADSSSAAFPELASEEFETPYYFRINDDFDPEDGATLGINNGGPSLDERSVVDAGFLELVRLGVRPYDETAIQNSVAVVDSTIRTDTENGPGWFRYTGDGYGEQPEVDPDEESDFGAPWSIDVGSLGGGGKGRLWPIFAGERAEYELRAGTSSGATAPQNLLETMANFANSGRMIPEQVWDREAASPYNWEQGEGTGSATPLAWSQAQFVRLAHGVDAGDPVETPAFVEDRYVNSATPSGPSLSATIPEQSTSGTVTVEGTTDADANVVVKTPTGTVEPSVGSDGSFSADVDLQSGANHVVVAATTSAESLQDVGTAVRTGTVENTGLGTKVATWSDTRGDGDGPGTYTRPTNSAFDPGLSIFDITSFDVYDGGDRYRFKYTFDNPLTNPWGGSAGWSHQFLQIYLRDPDADGGSTAARTGVNAEFEAAYHYRIVATGYGTMKIEDAQGNEVSGDVSAIAFPESGGIALDVPKDAIGDVTSMAVAPLVCAQDGYQPGKVRPVNETASGYVFGGGEGSGAGEGNDPNVLDVVTPADSSNADALGYSDSSLATIPFLSVGSGVGNVYASSVDGRTVSVYPDVVGDDHGPGSYTYPKAGVFYDGAFDLSGVAVMETDSAYKFVYRIAGGVKNPWGGSGGFSVQSVQAYLRDPTADGGSVQARTGVNAEFDAAYHYRVAADGFPSEFPPVVEDAQGNVVAQTGVSVSANADIGAVVLTVPKSAFGDTAITDMEAAFLLLGQDGYAPGRIRSVDSTAGDWSFGGGTDDGNDPNAIDLVTPDGTTNADALSYSSESMASIPYVPVGSSGDGNDGGSGAPFDAPLGNLDDVPADPDGDGLYEDVNGDGDSDVVDVQALFSNSDADLTAEQRAALDFNGDGSVDVLDVQSLFSDL